MRRLSPVDRFKVILLLAALGALGVIASGGVRSSARVGKTERTPEPSRAPARQTPAQTAATPAPSPTPSPAPSPARAEQPKIEGCISCHGRTEPMHKTRDGKLKDDGTDRMSLSCTSCHGGNPFARVDEAARGQLRRGDAEFEKVMRAAHVAPRFPERWAGRDGKYSSANPERTNALLAAESREFVRFVNPGDLRVAELTCASTGCHAPEVAAARNSMMRHGAMLWGAALYNNGGFPSRTRASARATARSRARPSG